MVAYHINTFIFECEFQLLDLCVLDVEMLQYQYSVLAASALYHISSKELALSVSGKLTLSPKELALSVSGKLTLSSLNFKVGFQILFE